MRPGPPAHGGVPCRRPTAPRNRAGRPGAGEHGSIHQISIGRWAMLERASPSREAASANTPQQRRDRCPARRDPGVVSSGGRRSSSTLDVSLDSARCASARDDTPLFDVDISTSARDGNDRRAPRDIGRDSRGGHRNPTQRTRREAPWLARTHLGRRWEELGAPLGSLVEVARQWFPKDFLVATDWFGRRKYSARVIPLGRWRTDRKAEASASRRTRHGTRRRSRPAALNALRSVGSERRKPRAPRIEARSS